MVEKYWETLLTGLLRGEKTSHSGQIQKWGKCVLDLIRLATMLIENVGKRRSEIDETKTDRVKMTTKNTGR